MIKTIIILIASLALISCDHNSSEQTDMSLLIYKVDVSSFNECNAVEPYCDAGATCSQFPDFGYRCYPENSLEEIAECSEGYAIGEMLSNPSQIRCFEGRE